MVPRGLVVVLGLLLIGFAVSMRGSIRKKSLETEYQPLGSAGTASALAQSQMVATSYQNPAGDGYAIPPQQKDLTYCVIDGRLVDQ